MMCIVVLRRPRQKSGKSSPKICPFVTGAGSKQPRWQNKFMRLQCFDVLERPQVLSPIACESIKRARTGHNGACRTFYKVYPNLVAILRTFDRSLPIRSNHGYGEKKGLAYEVRNTKYEIRDTLDLDLE